MPPYGAADLLNRYACLAHVVRPVDPLGASYRLGTGKPPADRWRRSVHRRRWAAAMRALPSAVRGPVLLPPWKRQRSLPFALVGKCLIAWPHIEAEMALVLGQLLGADSAAALAVFQTLRRSSAQRDAISEAAKASLNEIDQRLLTSILNVHKAVEAERNALAHGHLGTYSDMPDGILWMTTADYIAFKANLVLRGDRINDDAKREKLNSCLSYYKAPDLEAIHRDIDTMGWIWSETITYLQELNPKRRAELYRQLCDRPRIAQALAELERGS